MYNNYLATGTSTAISSYDSHNLTIFNNTFTNARTAINSYNITDHKIFNNTITVSNLSANSYALGIAGINVEIYQNIIRDCTYYCILVASGDLKMIENINIHNNYITNLTGVS